jgi:hypothetical protein
VQRLDDRVRIEEQLQDRLEQPADPLKRRAVRLVDRLVFEHVIGRRRLGCLSLAKLFEEVGPYSTWIKKLLELHRRQLANLLLGIVHPALLSNARADLLHDLLDVDRIGADVEVRHDYSATGR